MTAEPAQARLCRCQRPLVEGDTCLRCGRSSGGQPVEPLFAQLRPPCGIAWTRPRVIRAIRAFAFFRGRPPARGDWRRPMGKDWPSLETVEDLFGSLEAATAAAELRPRA